MYYNILYLHFFREEIIYTFLLEEIVTYVKFWKLKQIWQ